MRFASLLRASLVGACLVPLAALSGCGDDDVPPVPPYDAGPPRDSGPRDAGPPRDGGDLDGALGDGGELPDGSVGPSTCTVASPDDLFALTTDLIERDRTPTVAANASGFAVAWSETRGSEDVFVWTLPPGATTGTETRVTMDSAISRDPAISANGTGWAVAWYDNSMAGYEIYAQALATSGMPMGTPTRLTSNMARDDSPAILSFGSGLLAAWVTEDLMAGSRTASTRLLAATTAPSAAATAITAPPLAPTSLVLSPLMDGAGLGWAQTSAGVAQAYVQRVGMDGHALGTAQMLSTEANADGSIYLATTSSGGGAVFGARISGVRPEVRFRPIDGTGAPSGPERIITPTPELGQDASIAAFAGGYVVAYRAAPDGTITVPTLRLALLDSLGGVISKLDLDATEMRGGRTSIAVAPDGRILVVWSESTDTKTNIRAARITCS